LFNSEAKPHEEVFFKNLDYTNSSMTLLRREEQSIEKAELASYLTVTSQHKKKKARPASINEVASPSASEGINF
jgi:hypothetical protein